MTATLKRVELWSDWPWNSGTPIGDIPVESLTRIHGRRGVLINETIEGTVARTWADAPSLQADRVAVLVYSDDSIKPFRIAETVRGLSAGRIITFRGNGPEQDMVLGEKKLYQVANHVAVFAFQGSNKTPSSHITDYILPNLPTWFDLGTVTPTAPVTVAYADDSPLSGLLKICAAANLADGADNVVSARPHSAGCYIDVTAYGASATVPDLRPGKSVRELIQTSRLADATNRLFLTAPDGQSCGRAYWQVESVTANTYIVIKDINGSSINPMLSTTQWGATPYWFHDDGVSHQVTSIDVANRRLYMSSTTGIAAGEWGWVAMNSAGDEIPYVDDTTRQPLIRIGDIRAPDGSSLTNFAKNGTLPDWTGSLPTGFTSPYGTNPAKETTVGKWLTGGQSAKFSGGSTQSLLKEETVYLKAGETLEAAVWLMLEQFSSYTQDYLNCAFYSTGGTLLIPDNGYLLNGTNPGFTSRGAFFRSTVGRYTATADGAVKVRILMVHYDTSSVWYFDAVSYLNVPSNLTPPTFPIVGSGAADLWLRAIQYHLDRRSRSSDNIEIDVADLARVDPTGAGEYEAITVGGSADVTVPDLGIASQYYVVEKQVNELVRYATKLILGRRLGPLSVALNAGGGGLGSGSGLGSGGGGGGTTTTTTDTSGQPQPVTPTNVIAWPSSPLPGAHMYFEADQGLGTPADSDPITTWGDLSGNGFDLSNTGGTDRPLWRADLDGDGMPLLSFDGSNDLLKRYGMSAYTGNDMTLYFVVRWTLQGAGTNPGLMSLSRTGQTDSATGCAGVTINTTSGGAGIWAHNLGGTVKWNASSLVEGAATASVQGGEYIWRVMCFRFSTIMGRYVVSSFQNDGASAHDYGASPSAFNFTDVLLAARYNGGGAENGFLPSHWRVWGKYHVAHREDQVKYMMQYLSSKWKVRAIY